MSTHTDFRAIYFPYCIEQQDDGEWLVLNRSYKPVGFNTDELIKYEEYPVASKLSGLGPAKLKRLSYSGEVEGNRVYLYNDGCNPVRSAANMTAYLEKLKILAALGLVRD